MSSITCVLNIRPQDLHMSKSEMPPVTAGDPVLHTFFLSINVQWDAETQCDLLQTLTLEYQVWSTNKLSNVPEKKNLFNNIFVET